jgi:sugar phosphate permease
MTTMATVAAGAYVINAGAALGAGWAIDRWIAKGHSADRTHKTIMVTYHLLGVVCMIGIVELPLTTAIACLYLYQFIVGVGSPGTFSISQTLAGPEASARWVGVQNTCGNVAGLAAPVITGLIVGATGHFERAFVLAAAINLLGIVGWLWLVPKIEPITWQKRPVSAAA